MGGGELRCFGCGGFGLLGGGAAGGVGRAAGLAPSLAGIVTGLDLLALLPAGDGVGCGLRSLLLAPQRLDVGLIGGFVKPFSLFIGFQFLLYLPSFSFLAAPSARRSPSWAACTPAFSSRFCLSIWR